MQKFIATFCLNLTLATPVLGQSIFPDLMYGIYALDDSCAQNSRRLIITPTDILIADPALDIRISYPDQRQNSGDQISLAGNFFVSVLYDGIIERTPSGAIMTFNFPDLSFPLLAPIMESILGEDIPSAINASINIEDRGDTVLMTLMSEDVTLAKSFSSIIGTWTFDPDQITRTRQDKSSTYRRCFNGLKASEQHASLVDGKIGIYGFKGQCARDSELFIIAKDGWGVSLPFYDPTVGFAYYAEDNTLAGELYRAPFAPLAPNENSYIDIEVRDGAPNHQLEFIGDKFSWIKTLTDGSTLDAGNYEKCDAFEINTFASAIAALNS
ncbi:MAG: hypothetical protein ACPGRH_05275 [Alphaproteobacteria bacterium]